MRKLLWALAIAGVCCLPAALLAQQAEPSPTPSALPTQAPAFAGSPIQIESCTLAVSGTPLYGTTGILAISFTNEGNVTANVVRWKLTWGQGKVAYIRDEGTFSPGITILHNFKQASGIVLSPLFSKPNVTCAPAWVKLDNGQMWQAGPNDNSGVSATLKYN